MNFWKTKPHHEKIGWITIIVFIYFAINGQSNYLEPVAAIGLLLWALFKDSHERNTDSACFGVLILWGMFYVGNLIQVPTI